MKRALWCIIPRCHRRRNCIQSSYEKTIIALTITGISVSLISSSPSIGHESDWTRQEAYKSIGSAALCSCEKSHSEESKNQSNSIWWNESTDDEDLDFSTDEEQYSEPYRWEQALIYHRKLLPEYRIRWDENNPNNHHVTTTKRITSPDDEILITHKIPTTIEEVSRLENELNDGPSGAVRNQLLYRIAMFYCWNPKNQIQIYKRDMIEDYNDSMETTIYQQRLWAIRALRSLALLENHVDAQYALGRISAQGWDQNFGGGGEPDPTQACVWYELASISGHPQASYELGVALYTGEGIAEDEQRAVHLFEQAASLGHAQAAYMLGDCLLEGIGTLRDRAEALEWLVAAAELGHRTAQSRVLAVLTLKEMEENENDEEEEEEKQKQKQKQKKTDIKVLRWKATDIVPERQFTIGGGKRNPVVLARRKSVVQESRGDESPVMASQSLPMKSQGKQN
jgi:hypothetical protein